MTTTEKRDVAEKRLVHLYEHTRFDMAHSISIRNWCITVTLGMVAVITMQRVNLEPIQARLLVILPVFLFWVLDSFQHTFISLNKKRTKLLEHALANDEEERFNDEFFYLFRGLDRISFWTKLRTFLRVVMLSETVILFYVLLIIGSLTVVSVLKISSGESH